MEFRPERPPVPKIPQPKFAHPHTGRFLPSTQHNVRKPESEGVTGSHSEERKNRFHFQPLQIRLVRSRTKA